MKRGLWVLALLAGAVSRAGELPLQVEGEQAYHRLEIPLAVRAQASRADLGDLRVLNAAGEVLPFAWVDEERGVTASSRRQPVPLFKAPAAASAVEPSLQGGWLIDLRAIGGAPQELQLTLAPGSRGVYAFMLEASPDLQRWHTLQADAQLVSLEHQGLRLEHSSFDLAGVPPGSSLRLRPRPGSEVPPLAGAQVVSVSQRSAVPEWQWSEPVLPSRCEPRWCDYPLPRHLPLQRLQVELAQTNTLARVQVLAQPELDDDAQSNDTTRRLHHPLHGQVKALRHKTAPDPATREPVWESLASGTVYALTLQGQDLRSTVLPMPGGHYSHLRLQPTGGIAQLGSPAPAIRVAGRATSLVFLARGSGPYRLAWGQTSPDAALPARLSLAELMPGRKAADALPEVSARPAASPAPVAAPPPVASAPTPAVPARKLWLWGVLVAALGLLGAMAWALLKPATARSSKAA
ncbi:DUF3999 family protein [Ideonella sp. YS5]|uniref:DUF3999 family protein n=1 Tax=Ideonella sp. YS5 TaxID=3453714 RepID=UPI003EEF0C5C